MSLDSSCMYFNQKSYTYTIVCIQLLIRSTNTIKNMLFFIKNVKHEIVGWIHKYEWMEIACMWICMGSHVHGPQFK